MNDILNKMSVFLIFSSLTWLGCTKKSVNTINFQNYVIKIEDLNFIPDKEKNLITDIPENESYFIDTSMNVKLSIIYQEDNTAFSEFFQVGSEQHEICSPISNAFPDNYFNLWNCTSISESRITKESTNYILSENKKLTVVYSKTYSNLKDWITVTLLREENDNSSIQNINEWSIETSNKIEIYQKEYAVEH